MIVEVIVSVLLDIVGLLIGTLPQAGTLGLDGFGEAVAAMGALNAGLPIVEVLAMAGMCLAIIGGIFVTRLFLTIWHAVPGKFS